MFCFFSLSNFDGIKKLLKFAPAGAMALLHEIADVVTVPENDSYGTVTALLLNLLPGKPVGYLEFYEFTETSALMGVPDYVPGKLVEGKITVSQDAESLQILAPCFVRQYCFSPISEDRQRLTSLKRLQFRQLKKAL